MAKKTNCLRKKKNGGQNKKTQNRRTKLGSKPLTFILIRVLKKNKTKPTTTQKYTTCSTWREGLRERDINFK